MNESAAPTDPPNLLLLKNTTPVEVKVTKLDNIDNQIGALIVRGYYNIVYYTKKEIASLGI